MLTSIALIVAVTVPGIDFPLAFAPASSPVRIDECGASREGGDLVYRFDLSNTSSRSVTSVEVVFVFESRGDKHDRGVQQLHIVTSMDAGQSLRYSTRSGELRRADVSHGARYGACSVTGVEFADGSRVLLPLDRQVFTKEVQRGL
jgi:hypothetical protein